MGFFGIDAKRQGSKASANLLGGISLDTLHRKQCDICPLNTETGSKHPHMEPAGAKNPLIYMLGEAPGAEEDRRGTPFVGKAGKLVRKYIPDEFVKQLRWNNCVRTRPPKDRSPTQVEVECCRPSVVKDIETSKPVAIFGFGNAPLNWLIGANTITKWRGRYVPVKVGNHVCWYFPMLHPAYVIRSAEERGQDLEFVFEVDMINAFKIVGKLPEPEFHDRDYAMSDIVCVDGSRGAKDVRLVTSFLDNLHDNVSDVGLDYETSCLRPYSDGALLLTVGLACQGQALAFSWDHPESKWTTEHFDLIRKAFKRFLYEAKSRKVVHSLSFEQEWSAYLFGKEVLRSGFWEDTMVQAYVLDERQDMLSLDLLCLQHFGIGIKALSNVDRKQLEKTDLTQVLTYNALDAKYHRLLYLAQKPRLENDKMTKVYDQHMRRVPTMVLTQLKGIPIDQSVTKKFDEDYTDRLTDIESTIATLSIVKKFRDRYHQDFRPSAPHDVLKLVKNILGIPIASTDVKVLKEIDHPFVDQIIEWRDISKQLSTYVKPFLIGSPLIYPDGNLHPTISTTKTVTSRTSSEGPNQQNWPKRKHKELRRQVKHTGGYKVVSFDYGQIQARNVAMESLDKNLIKAFWDRYDIHTDFMEKVAQRYPQWLENGVKTLRDKDLKRKYRNRAKNEFVFPSFFGAQPSSISRNLGIPQSIAQDLLEGLFDRFPDIQKWHERIRKTYHQLGYVQGLSGYRRRAPVGFNEIINSPIQADEALIVCDAMARLSERGIDQFQASMEIHDDLTFFWPKKDIERNAEVVIEAMLNTPFKWAHVVPIVVEMSVGDDWESCKEVGVYDSDKWSGIVRIGNGEST